MSAVNTGFTRADTKNLEQIMEIISDIITCPDKKMINMWDTDYPTRDIFYQDIQEERLFLYWKDGELAGLFVLMEDKLYEDNANWQYEGPFLVIHRFCVTPKLHGQGIGKEMLTYIEKQAQEGGFKALRLDTYSQNPRSQKLYTGAGFEYAGDIKGRSGIYRCYEKPV